MGKLFWKILTMEHMLKAAEKGKLDTWAEHKLKWEIKKKLWKTLFK